jgi:hypothetical protein
MVDKVLCCLTLINGTGKSNIPEIGGESKQDADLTLNINYSVFKNKSTNENNI